MPIPPEDMIGKVSIEKVQNGYILRVLKGNCDEFKEKYLNEVMVFTEWQELVDWLVMRF
jgi:hypothetical protein